MSRSEGRPERPQPSQALVKRKRHATLTTHGSVRAPGKARAHSLEAVETLSVPLPLELGTRLCELFGLGAIPRTLGDFAAQVRKRWTAHLDDTSRRAYLEAIASGREAFGTVDYGTATVVRLA